MRLTTSSSPTASGAAPTPEMLGALGLFGRLPEAELEQLCCLLRLSSARPGTVLATQDVPVRRWQLLVAGHAVVERDATPLGLVGAGDSWCEHSMLNDVRSPIGVVALSPVTLVSVSKEQFFTLPEDHPLLAGRLVARSATSADRLALPVRNALIHLSAVPD